MTARSSWLRGRTDTRRLGTKARLPSPTSLAALELAVAEQHLTNFELWHAEDCARAPGASNEDLARIKRFIDSTNQRRNDLTERVRRTPSRTFWPNGICPNKTPSSIPKAPVSSSIGSPFFLLRSSIRNRRSTGRRLRRDTANAIANACSSSANKETIWPARLGRLWQQVLAGQRRFRLYLQLKMYNDPALNPAIYSLPPRSG